MLVIATLFILLTRDVSDYNRMTNVTLTSEISD